jgi:hypothetical protein
MSGRRCSDGLGDGGSVARGRHVEGGLVFAYACMCVCYQKRLTVVAKMASVMMQVAHLLVRV